MFGKPAIVHFAAISPGRPRRFDDKLVEIATFLTGLRCNGRGAAA